MGTPTPNSGVHGVHQPAPLPATPTSVKKKPPKKTTRKPPKRG